MREGETHVTRILALCDEEIAIGFRLAGITASAPQGRQAVEVALSEELEKARFGLVLIDAKLFEDIDDRLRQKALESELPFVLAFPLGLSDVAPEELDRRLGEMVRQMTGFNLLGGL